MKHWHKAKAKIQLSSKISTVREGQPVNFREEGDDLYIRFTYFQCIVSKLLINSYLIPTLGAGGEWLECRVDVSNSLEESFQNDLNLEKQRALEKEKSKKETFAFDNMTELEKANYLRKKQAEKVLIDNKSKTKELKVIALHQAGFKRSEIPSFMPIDASYLEWVYVNKINGILIPMEQREK